MDNYLYFVSNVDSNDSEDVKEAKKVLKRESEWHSDMKRGIIASKHSKKAAEEFLKQLLTGIDCVFYF